MAPDPEKPGTVHPDELDSGQIEGLDTKIVEVKAGEVGTVVAESVVAESVVAESVVAESVVAEPEPETVRVEVVETVHVVPAPGDPDLGDSVGGKLQWNDPLPVVPVPIQEPGGSSAIPYARLLLVGGTAIAVLASLFLLLDRSSKQKSAVVPVPVAAPVIAVSAPINTVVPPLDTVVFTPPVDGVPGDLAAYAPELIKAARPLIAIDYTAIVDDPKPWSSHMYGTADLPSSVSVPVDETGQPLCMVAQINLSELPALPAVSGNASTVAALPKAGVLQFWLAIDPPGGTGWTRGPRFEDTVAQPRQRVVFISEADMAEPPQTRSPSASRCAGNPPAQGPVVALAMEFSVKWNVPETTDSRFDSALPLLAGALRSTPADEFYRALGSINEWLGATSNAQLGGYNRLVNQDPRAIEIFNGEDVRDGILTDAFEVLFELHSAVDENEGWSIGFGSQGSGGWWADPRQIARLADVAGPTGGRSGSVQSAFWWDAQAGAPAVVEE
jgi:Domain of unknown function (DUF1963)